MDPRNPTCMESLLGAVVGSMFIGICMLFLPDSWLIGINVIGCTLTVIAIYGFATYRWKNLNPEKRNRQWEKYQTLREVIQEIGKEQPVLKNQSKEHYEARLAKIEAMKRVLDDYRN